MSVHQFLFRVDTNQRSTIPTTHHAMELVVVAFLLKLEVTVKGFHWQASLSAQHRWIAARKVKTSSSSAVLQLNPAMPMGNKRTKHPSSSVNPTHCSHFRRISSKLTNVKPLPPPKIQFVIIPPTSCELQECYWSVPHNAAASVVASNVCAWLGSIL